MSIIQFECELSSASPDDGQQSVRQQSRLPAIGSSSLFINSLPAKSAKWCLLKILSDQIFVIILHCPKRIRWLFFDYLLVSFYFLSDIIKFIYISRVKNFKIAKIFQQSLSFDNFELSTSE